MAEKLIQLVSGMTLEWQVFILAMFPITELRAAIPYGISQGLSPSTAFIVATTGNFLISIPILFLLNPAIHLISKVPIGKKIVTGILEKTRKKGSKVTQYGTVGLALFVGLPVPGTGVWTGSLLAYLFGLKVKSTIAALGLGVISAGLIVTFLSVGAIDKLGLSFNQIIVILFLIILISYINNKKKKI